MVPVALAQPLAPSFDVATVKLAAPNQNSSESDFGRGLLHLNNFTLKAAILFAYDLHDYQLSGGPKWVVSEAFDIVGKAESPETKPEILRAMLRTLLAERFQLTLRKETKPLPAYALVIAKGGLKLEKAAPGSPKNGYWSSGPTMLKAYGMLMARIANIIAAQVGRPVVDRTQAEGLYNLTMHFAPENAPPPEYAPPNATEPSFFTAL